MQVLTRKRLWMLSVVVVVLGFLLYNLSAVTQTQRQHEGLEVKMFSQQFVNVFLLSQGDNHLLIDAGLDSQQDLILSFLAENGVPPDRLQAVIVTHGHHDHAGTAAFFQRQHKIPVVAGKGDLPLFAAGRNDVLCPTGALAKLRHDMDQKGQYPAFVPDIIVEDSLELATFTGIKGQVHTVPGHTPGSLVVVFDDVAFVGDMVRGGLLLQHQAAMHFYQCDLKKLADAMTTTLEQLAKQVTTFYPSHIGPVSRDSMVALLKQL